MKNLGARIVLIATAIFFASTFFIKEIEPLSATLTDFAIIILAFAMMIGIINLIKYRLYDALDKKKDYLYSLLVVISFLVTISAGLFNIGEKYFVSKAISFENPKYIKTVIREIFERDPYLKHFPAREKVKLIVERNFDHYFIPSEKDLAKAALSLQEYFSFFNDKGEVDVSLLKATFLAGDVEVIENILEKISSVSDKCVNEIYPLSKDIRSWVQKSASDYYNGVNTTKIKELELNDYQVKGSYAILASYLKSLYPKKENGIKEIEENYGAFLEESKLSFHISKFVAQITRIGVSPHSEPKIIGAFLSSGITTFHSLKGSLKWIFNTIYNPLSSTTAALLAFFIVSAIYRTFRFNSFNATIFVLSALLIIIGQIPLLNFFSALFFPEQIAFANIAEWILAVPSMAAQRAINIGIGIGAVFVLIRLISGVDKNYFGKDE